MEILTFIASLHPTVWVAAITLIGTFIAQYVLRKNKKEEAATRVFHDLATDLVKDNVSNLMNQNDKLMDRLDSLEKKNDVSGDEVEKLRDDAFQLRMRIVSFKTMLETIAFSADQLIKLYDHLEPSEFKQALQNHYDSIQEAISRMDKE